MIREGYYSEPQAFTSTLDAYEALIGRRPAMYMWYVGFDTAFPLTNVQQVAARGQTPIISWMPNVTSGTPSTNANIIAGLWDTYIDTFATAVKNYGGPVWLRLGFEMNGSWFQWGNTSFIGMWARVQDRFRAQAVTNVTWVWSPNVIDPSYIPLDQVFPGISRVDVVGLDGYNWGSPTVGGHSPDWRLFAEIFDESITQVRLLAPGKPLWITEMASSGLGGSKAAWISDALSQIRNYGLDGWIWFDAAKAGEPDFRVNSSAASLAAFRDGALYGSPPARLVTNARIPLCVRLVTARADRHVTRDLHSLSFRSAAPGGFASAQLELARSVRFDAPEIQAYGKVFVYDGRTGETVWEGYQDDPGAAVSDSGEVRTLTASGPAARAKDRKLPLVYLDGRLSEWEPSEGYGGVNMPTAQIATQGGAGEQPGLRMAFPRGMVVPVNGRVTVNYAHMLASGQRLARLDAIHVEGVAPVWWQQWQVLSAAGVGINTGHDVWSTTQQLITALITTDFSAITPMAMVNWMATNGTGGTVGNDVTWSLTTLLRVQPVRMTAAGVELLAAADYPNSYVLAHQVVNDLLGRILTTYDGANARVDTTSYTIDQLAYAGGATPAQILEDLMSLEPAYYWAAWESTSPLGGKARFEWRTWPTTVRYEADISGGFENRPAPAELFNQVRVRWTDQVGRTHTTVRTQAVQALTDAGLTVEDLLDLGQQVGSSGNADRAGDGFLGEHATTPNAGTLTVTRPVLDRDTGRMVAPYMIRPGHLIRVRGLSARPDSLNPAGRDGTTVFRITNTSYDTVSAAAHLDLDTYPRTVAQAIARVGKALSRMRRM